MGIELRSEKLQFLDRYVVLARGFANQITSSLDALNDIAEVRLAKVPATSVLQYTSRSNDHGGRVWLLDFDRPLRTHQQSVCSIPE